jgi:uncharacterized membrane protein
MYEFLVYTHNIVRWILLPVMLVVIALSWTGLMGKRGYTKADKALGGALLGLTHLQLLLGLILFFVSPAVQSALADFGAAMKNAPLRKIVLEHPLIGLIAAILVQVGRTVSKKAVSEVKKHKAVAVYTTIAMMLILSRIPHWNF